MTIFSETKAAADFIATGDARETSLSIMEAIVAFAGNIAGDIAGAIAAETAKYIWEQGLVDFDDASVREFFTIATRNNQIPIGEIHWGASTGIEIVPAHLRAEYGA